MTARDYKISTIHQITQLTPEQQKGFLIDFAAWLEIVNDRDSWPKGWEVSTSSITWRDDGNWGKCHGVRVMK